MTMRTVSRLQTPCETLRQINDLCQDDTEKDKIIRELLFEFELMAKMLSKEINERPGPKISECWWDKNRLNFKGLRKLRMGDLYKCYTVGGQIKEYIIGLLLNESSHQTSCAFPGEDCTCKSVVEIDYNTSLLRDGYIDSFTVETIVVFLEESFDISIPPSDVNPGNFDTINKMIGLINRL